MTLQEQMKTKLESLDIPAKEIQCYGRQIVITCWSDGAARKWASLLAKFATVRGIVQSTDQTKDVKPYFKANPGIVRSHTSIRHDVWRVFAAIS